MTTRREFLSGTAAATVPLILGVTEASAAEAAAPKEVFVVNTQRHPSRGWISAP